MITSESHNLGSEGWRVPVWERSAVMWLELEAAILLELLLLFDVKIWSIHWGCTQSLFNILSENILEQFVSRCHYVYVRRIVAIQIYRCIDFLKLNVWEIVNAYVSAVGDCEFRKMVKSNQNQSIFIFCEMYKFFNFTVCIFVVWLRCCVFFLTIIPIILLRHLMSMNFWWHSISFSQRGSPPSTRPPHCHCSHHKHPVPGRMNIVSRTFEWNAAIRLLHCTGCITQTALVPESWMVWRNLYKLQLILHRYLHFKYVLQRFLCYQL